MFRSKQRFNWTDGSDIGQSPDTGQGSAQCQGPDTGQGPWHWVTDSLAYLICIRC